MCGRFPIRIVSDLHLAHPASLVKNVWQLEPLLAGAGTVVFNGDTTEQRLPETRKTAERYLETLRKLCADLGVEPVFLSGNHDPEGGEHSLELLGGRFLVTHGDVLFPDVTPWGRDAAKLREHRERVLREIGEGEPEWEALLRACKEASASTDVWRREIPDSRRAWLMRILRETGHPLRALQVIRAWATLPGRAAVAAEEHRPGARWIAVGHTHLPGWWRRGERVVFNTGAYLPWLARTMVEISAESVSMCRVERDGKFFRRGKTIFREAIDEFARNGNDRTSSPGGR